MTKAERSQALATAIAEYLSRGGKVHQCYPQQVPRRRPKGRVIKHSKKT